jgi:lipoate-protein ligase A
MDYDSLLPAIQAPQGAAPGRDTKAIMKFEKLPFIQENEPKAAAENMAVDEVLLFTADCPVFRSYSWIRPSVSCGYFTPWEAVVSQYAERDLVRRWTAGGIRRLIRSCNTSRSLISFSETFWSRGFDHTSYSVWPLWLLQAQNS